VTTIYFILTLSDSDLLNGYGDVIISTHVFPNKIDIIGVEIEIPIDLSPIWSCYNSNDPNISLNVRNSLFELTKINSNISYDFNAHHPACCSSFSSRHGNMIYEIINSLRLSIINNGTSTLLERPKCDNSSSIDIFFSSPN